MKRLFPKDLSGFSTVLRRHLESAVLNDRIKSSTLNAIPYWVGAALTALVAVLYAKTVGGIEKLALDLFHLNPAWLFLASPLLFLLSWFLVFRFSPEAAGSGIPQLMVAAESAMGPHASWAQRLLSVRSIIVKVASSCLALAGGGAIGREGPTLQISAALFYQLGRRLGPAWPKPNLQFLTIAGGAAGLAAAFNTPLGGIVYAVEELANIHLGSFRTPILHAVLVAGLVAQLLLGPYLYLGYPELGSWSASQFPIMVTTGLVGGLLGALYGRLLLYVVQRREKIRLIRSHIAWSLGCGLVFALLAMVCGYYTLGSGKELMNDLLFQNGIRVPWFLPLARTGGNLITVAAGGAGGIFAPALASGAAVGAELAAIFTDMNFNLLVLLGMISFLTGVTHTPLTSFVLVLEMSDRHSAIFPMMIAALCASTAARWIDRASFYEHMRKRIENQLTLAEASFDF